MDSSRKSRISNGSGSRAATTAVATSSASVSSKHDWPKAKLAWTDVYTAKKDNAVQFDRLVTTMQSVEASFGAAPDFAGKPEAIEMLKVCTDVIKDFYDDANVETERALTACKAFQDDSENACRDKLQDKLMLQATKMMHTVDEKMTVGELRKMLLSDSITLRNKTVSSLLHGDLKTIIDSFT